MERRRVLQSLSIIGGGGLSVPFSKLAYADEQELTEDIENKSEETTTQQENAPLIIPFGEQSPIETYGQYVFRITEEEGSNWRVRSDWFWEVIIREYRDYIVGNRPPESDNGPFYGPMQFSPSTFRAFYRDPDVSIEEDLLQRTNKKNGELVAIMRNPRINIITAVDLLYRLGPRSIYQQWPNTGPAAMRVLGMRYPEEIILPMT